jgi:hypothetical protein
MHEIFDLFHQSTSYKSLINRLKPFGIYCSIVFAEITATKVVKIGFSGVNDPAEIENEVYNSPTFFV